MSKEFHYQEKNSTSNQKNVFSFLWHMNYNSAKSKLLSNPLSFMVSQYQKKRVCLNLWSSSKITLPTLWLFNGVRKRGGPAGISNKIHFPPEKEKRQRFFARRH